MSSFIRCNIIGCQWKNRKKHPNMSTHRLPRGEDKRKKWLDIIGTENINLNKKKVYVCSAHFDDDAFNKTLDVLRLRDDAMPLAHLLPITTKDREMGAKSAVKLRRRPVAYKCNICGRQLTTPDALMAHQRTAHNIITRRRGRPAAVPATKPVKLNEASSNEEIEAEIATPPKCTQTIDETAKMKNRVEFECPKCYKRFPTYFPARRHIQKYHCVDKQGVAVPPHHPNLIRPVRLELCTKCMLKVESIENHVCVDPLKYEDDTRLVVCAACEEWFPSVNAFDTHVVSAHADMIESMFFPTSLEFCNWKTEMEEQTKVSYELSDTCTDSKKYYHCNYGRDLHERPYKCPSTVITQEFPKGFQVHYYQKHHKHPSTAYNLSHKYKKYSITSFLKSSQEYNSLVHLKPDDDDLYMQFKTLMEGIVVDAAKINIATLKIILGKALEITSILTNYDEELDDVPMCNSRKMSDDQITQALEDTPTKRKTTGTTKTSTTTSGNLADATKITTSFSHNLLDIKSDMKRKTTDPNKMATTSGNLAETTKITTSFSRNLLERDAKRKSMDTTKITTTTSGNLAETTKITTSFSRNLLEREAKRKTTDTNKVTTTTSGNLADTTKITTSLSHKLLEIKRKNAADVEMISGLHEKRIKFDNIVERKENETETPKIVGSYSLADALKNCKPVKVLTENIALKSISDKVCDKPKLNSEDEKKLKVNGEPSSFNDSYKDFVVKNFPYMESIASRTRSKPALRTQTRQYKSNVDETSKSVPASTKPDDDKAKSIAISTKAVDDKSKSIPISTKAVDDKAKSFSTKIVDDRAKLISFSTKTVIDKAISVSFSPKTVDDKAKSVSFSDDKIKSVPVSPKIVEDKTKEVPIVTKIVDEKPKHVSFSTKVVEDKTKVLPRIDVKIGPDVKQSPNTRGKSHFPKSVTTKAKVIGRKNSRASFDKPKVDFEYEVKEREEDCNILILKI